MTCCELHAGALEVGELDEVGRLSNLALEQGALARRLEAEAAAIPAGRRVPMRQGRKARASFLGELAEENPELVQKYGDELARGAERGFNTIRDPVLREAIGLGDPALRFMGKNIPKTERLIYPAARAGGAARAASNKLPLLGSTMGRFAPKGLEEPLNTLTRGKGGDVLRAGTAVRIQNLMRRAAGSMEGRGNKALTDLVRSPEFRKATPNAIRAMVRQAEADDAPNAINKFFKKLTEVYESVAGRPIDVTRDENTYVPHMMTPQFKRYLRSKADKGGKEYEDLGFVVDDLLEGSKYLEKSRKLTPDGAWSAQVVRHRRGDDHPHRRHDRRAQRGTGPSLQGLQGQGVHGRPGADR